jgi:hypothetical protein
MVMYRECSECSKCSEGSECKACKACSNFIRFQKFAGSRRSECERIRNCEVVAESKMSWGWRRRGRAGSRSGEAVDLQLEFMRVKLQEREYYYLEAWIKICKTTQDFVNR